MHELKSLAQLPLVMVVTKLTWKSLSKEEKNKRLSDMWVAIVMAENPLLAKGMEGIYNWCLENY